MSFYVSKKDGKLIFEDLGGYETRNPSTFWCIQKADEKFNWKDFDKILIHTHDRGTNNDDYNYSKPIDYDRTVPDFNFHSWPQVGIDDYEQFVKEIDESGLNAYKMNKVGWIGCSDTHIIRKKLLEIGDQHKELFDIFDMNWIRENKGNIRLEGTRYISTPDLVKQYSMLIDIEGGGYSGRLKHLLWSHRPLLLVDRPHKEFFFQFLKGWVHYIPVKRDLSDLVEKTKWCLENYDKALMIADNAYRFSKLYLTRDACYDKWNDIISKHEHLS
jgi:hypothetical protein